MSNLKMQIFTVPKAEDETNDKKIRPTYFILTIIILTLAVLGLSIALAFVTGCFSASGLALT